jgi:predicted transcriptional regulator of viral defense system
LCIKPKTNREQLYRIAEPQFGYFTTKQVKRAGYTENNFLHHINTGSWIKRYRGIYRLAHFPESENSQLVLWSLWSRNRADIPQAVYSHDTALRIHELSDIMPSKLHITVPQAFRRNSDTPAILILHKAHLPEDDIQEMHGFRCTAPLRTLIDLIEAETVSPDLIKQALREGLAKGVITRYDIRTRNEPKAIMTIIRNMTDVQK